MAVSMDATEGVFSMRHLLTRKTANGGFIILVSLWITLTSQQAYSADAVYCVNCGTEWTQLLNKATMLKQVAQQAQQLQTEISQYQDMVTNSKGVSTQLFGKALQDFTQLQDLMQQSKAMAYSASDLDSQYASRYGTYNQYLGQQLGVGNFQNKYNQWSAEGSDNSQYALKGLNLQANQLKNDQGLLAQLQGMATSAEGRMQAMQVANMIAAQNVDQVMKLRELTMLQLQTQANYMAQQQDKEAMEAAARQAYYHLYTPKLNGERF
jgi:P-type conjugative transfer protein TrbJ